MRFYTLPNMLLLLPSVHRQESSIMAAFAQGLAALIHDFLAALAQGQAGLPPLMG